MALSWRIILMASRSSSMWVWSIFVVLFILTAASVGGYLLQYSKFTSAIRLLENGSAQDIADGGDGFAGNESVENVLSERDDLEKELETLRTATAAEVEEGVLTLPVLQARLDDCQRSAGEARQDLRDAESRIASLETELASKETTLEELKTQMEAAVNASQTETQAEIQRLRQAYEQEKARADQLATELRNREELVTALREDADARISDLNQEINDLQSVIEQKQEAARGREALLAEEYDGRIIAADVENKFVVVNLGTTHNVRPGMLFEVIRWRLNEWETLAEIEITKANPTTSEAVIREEIVATKVSPQTGWEAPDPAMIVDPYVVAEDGERPVFLVATQAEARPTMDPMDPILEGDYITNPFYSRSRQLRFVIAGESVRYSHEELRRAIEQSNGIVQDQVGPTTDYLVLGKVTDTETAFLDEETRARMERAQEAQERARNFSIPVMREVDLLNLLGR
jgi:hypothetical protein